ncbi:MAG TPA: DUF1328 domain-containing protein [Planctomycetota bacterium]|nr:DUF1328 domain-containing protein [Planctomycetota bacterium]
MLYYALTFLLVAILAGILGFGVVAGTVSLAAKIVFGIFMVLFILTLLTHTRRRRA